MFQNNHTSLIRLVACVLVLSSLPLAESKGADASATAPAVPKAPPVAFKFKTKDGLYQFTVDTKGISPEIAAWAREELPPLLTEWYPKIVKFLPSKGFNAPKNVSVIFDNRDDTKGWATAGRDYIRCMIKSFSRMEPAGRNSAIIHELVHVVQGYPKTSPRGYPGWLEEGIADYVKYYLYGDREHRIGPTANYNGSYMYTANFLHWVARTYDKDIVPKLNAACRQNNYSDSLWKKYTGHTVEELNAEWKVFLANPKQATFKYSDEDLRAAVLQQAQASPEKAK